MCWRVRAGGCASSPRSCAKRRRWLPTALEAARGVEAASGLKWLRRRVKPMEAVELVNPELAQAPSTRTEFTEAEFKAFKVKEVRSDRIQSGGTYFKPASVTRQSRGWWRPSRRTTV